MPHLYLTPWVWDGIGWLPPVEPAIASFDLRSLPECAAQGGPAEPKCLLLLANADPNLDGYIGEFKSWEDFKTASVPSRVKQGIESYLGLPGGSITADRPIQILKELLWQLSDPTGQNRWKPRPVGRMRIVRSGIGKWVDLEKASDSHPAFLSTVRLFREDYRRNKASGMNVVDLRRWVGATMLKLWGQMNDSLASVLLPPEYAGDGWQLPSTTLGDTFVEATDVDLAFHTATGPNGGFSWTNTRGAGSIRVNAASDLIELGTGFDERYRAESSLSSDDMYAQVKTVTLGASAFGGPAARYDPAADSFYAFAVRNNTTFTYRMVKFVGGTRTYIGGAHATPPTPPFTTKLVTDDAATNLQEGYVDGVLKLSTNDTALSGTLRSGVFIDGTGPQLDDFLAEDLAGGLSAAILRRRIEGE